MVLPPITLSKSVVEADNAAKNNKAKASCEAKGGIWNEATKECELPKKKPVEKPIPTKESQPLPTDQPIITTKEGEQKSQTEADLIRARRNIERIKAGRPTVEEEEEAATQAQVIEEERQALLEQGAPQERSLDPTVSLLEATPVIGGTFGAIKDRLQELVLTTVPEGKFKEQFKENLGIAPPEELRTMALTEIERQEVENGLSASEKFGALIEGIPIVGSLAAQYSGGLIETPSENAAQVKTDLLKEKRRINNIETNVKLGYLPATVARGQIDDIEANVQRLESRLKVLINNSPEMKFNNDLVNTYETEILLTREKIFQARLNILTGAATDPTEIQILQALQRQEQENELV